MAIAISEMLLDGSDFGVAQVLTARPPRLRGLHGHREPFLGT
jgi:hypothetical protein